LHIVILFSKASLTGKSDRINNPSNIENHLLTAVNIACLTNSFKKEVKILHVVEDEPTQLRD
jgi:hypothetical protein